MRREEITWEEGADKEGGGRIMKYKIPLHKSMHYLSLTSPLTMGVQLFSIRLAAS